MASLYFIFEKKVSADPPYSDTGLPQPTTPYGEACAIMRTLQRVLLLFCLNVSCRGGSSCQRLSKISKTPNAPCCRAHRHSVTKILKISEYMPPGIDKSVCHSSYFFRTSDRSSRKYGHIGADSSAESEMFGLIVDVVCYLYMKWG